MIARTRLQHALPTTFGLKAAGWLTLVLDAQERLRQVLASLPVQLGGAAGTLAADDIAAWQAAINRLLPGADSDAAGTEFVIDAGLLTK